MVEELVTGEYYTTTTLDASLAAVAEERARLKTSLQEILARNCSPDLGHLVPHSP